MNDKIYEFAPMLGPCEEYPPGSPEWAERISNRLQNQVVHLSRHTTVNLTRTLVAIVTTKPPPWDSWPAGRPFHTPDDYCLAVTGHSFDMLLQAVAELSPEDDPETPSLFSVRAMLARAQAEHKRPGGNPYEIRNGRKLSDDGGDGGTSAAYLLRRLARDDPDILDAYERGEFPSVRAAAKAAGIVRDPTPLELLRRDWAKASAAERETFLAEIGS